MCCDVSFWRRMQLWAPALSSRLALCAHCGGRSGSSRPARAGRGWSSLRSVRRDAGLPWRGAVAVSLWLSALLLAVAGFGLTAGWAAGWSARRLCSAWGVQRLCCWFSSLLPGPRPATALGVRATAGPPSGGQRKGGCEPAPPLSREEQNRLVSFWQKPG